MKAFRILFALSLIISVVSSAISQGFVARTDKIDIDFTTPTQVIVWITPDLEQKESESKKLDIKVGIQSDVPVKKVAIILNGLPVANNRGFTIKKSDDEKYDEIIEHSLNLADGDNQIRIVVEDAEGNRSEDVRVIRVLDAGLAVIKNRTDYALLFATNNYEDWSDLVNPVNDAREIARELKESYGFKVELIENATKEKILLKMREYSQKSYLDYDQLFIFFAGHGHYDEINGEGYIVTKDSRNNDMTFNSYLSHNILRNRINNVPSEHIFLVMDACFGGTFDPSIARSGSRGGMDIYQELTKLELIERRLQYKTRQYLTSGGKEYVPDGRPGMNSPFASKFLEALRGDGGPDQLLTINDIKEYVILVRPEPKQGPFGSNESGSDFVFERKRW